MAVSIYIPTNSAGGFLLSTPSPAFVVCGFFDDSHSDPCEVISHFLFALTFSFDLHLAILNIFSCDYWLSVCPLWKNVYSCILPIFFFFEWVFCFDAIKHHKLFVNFGD